MIVKISNLRKKMEIKNNLKKYYQFYKNQILIIKKIIVGA